MSIEDKVEVLDGTTPSEKEVTDFNLLGEEVSILQDLFKEQDVDFGFNTIAEILMMDDENFAVISEFFLTEFEATLKDNRQIFSMLARKNGYQLDDFQNAFKAIKEEVNAADELTQEKKDFLLRLIALIFNAFFEETDGITYISIPYELCRDVKTPFYAHDTDAGMDVYSPEEYTIAPGESIIIPTGIKMAIPSGYAILVQPRSGQSIKTKLRIANTPGLIDSGYRDEIGVIVENIEPEIKNIEYDFDDNGEIHIKSILHGNTYTITKGQKFAQLRLVEVPKVALLPVENIKEIEGDRGGGFGSTDKVNV